MDKALKKIKIKEEEETVSVNFSHTVLSFGFFDCWKWDQQVVPK